MGYAVIEQFAAGVDRTRPIYTLPPGSLWVGKNVHLSRGGDVEQRKAFVTKFTLPAGTFGFHVIGDVKYVWGSTADPGVPAGVTYQRLAHPDGAARTMTDVLSHDAFNGKMYVVAEFDDGSIHHYYDGAHVTDWDNGIVRSAMTNNDGIATHLAAVVNLLGGGIYTATAAGAVVTVTKTTGNFLTDAGVSTSVENVTGGTDDQTLTRAYTHAAASATFTVGGTFEVGDRFTIVLDTLLFGAEAMPGAKATVVKTHKRKVYAAAGNILHFSGLDSAVNWNRDEDAGAGFISFSDELGGAETIVSLAKYQNSLALMARSAIQLWTMQNDDALNAPTQNLEYTGSLAQESALQYGGIDTFYLSDTGIRSLRARDVTNTAAVSDVGTPIDTLIAEHMEDLTDEQIAAATTIVEPKDGRFMLALGERIYVFSYFPAKKISAWSWYELGFEVEHFGVSGRQLFARSVNTIYLYGGDSGAQYDAVDVDVWLPFMSVKKHGTYKQLKGLDIAAKGTWNIKVYVNPDMDVDDPTDYVDVGDLTGFTFSKENTGALGHVTHMSVRLTRSAASAASLSMVGVFYDGADTE